MLHIFLCRGCWDIASCQFSFNSIQWFQRRSWKCLSQLDARAAILYLRLVRKTQTWYRTLRSCFFSRLVEFCSAGSEKKLKMSQPIRGQGGHLVFPIGHLGFLIGPNNTNLVEVLIEIFLPVKFRSIQFSNFREVEIRRCGSIRS